MSIEHNGQQNRKSILYKIFILCICFIVSLSVSIFSYFSIQISLSETNNTLMIYGNDNNNIPIFANKVFSFEKKCGHYLGLLGLFLPIALFIALLFKKTGLLEYIALEFCVFMVFAVALLLLLYSVLASRIW